ncbi:MAG: hypothetical protein ACYDCL_14690 [Myxococcales bacterium]
MDMSVAALVSQYGISPPDFEALAGESDILSVQDGLLHDPDVCLEDVEHLEGILRGPIAWLPAVAPYGDLWRSVRVGPSARAVTLCPRCYR